MQNKKAQEILGMSFSTIFSIFIIVFILAVAFFAIRHFLGLSKCTNIGLFYDDLRDEVKDAWSSTSGRYKDEFTAKIPRSGLFGTGIEYVCFGKLSTAHSADQNSEKIKQELVNQYDYDPLGDENVFMYPPSQSCDANLGAIHLKCNQAECANTKVDGVDQFFCQEVASDGKISLWLSKESTDYQVSLRNGQ